MTDVLWPQDKNLADLKATDAAHHEICQPNPLGLRWRPSNPCPCGKTMGVFCTLCGMMIWAGFIGGKEPCICLRNLFTEDEGRQNA